MPHINSKIGGKPFVAGSVGPYGACLCDGSEYNGNYLKPDHPNSKPLGTDKTKIREFLRNWHRDRIKVNISSAGNNNQYAYIIKHISNSFFNYIAEAAIRRCGYPRSRNYAWFLRTIGYIRCIRRISWN